MFVNVLILVGAVLI